MSARFSSDEGLLKNGIVFLTLFFLSGCATEKQPVSPILWTPISFHDLPGWDHDSQANDALPVLDRLCQAALKKGPEAFFGAGPKASVTGKVQAWRTLCATVHQAENLDAKAFFEQTFTPYKVQNAQKTDGLFTGYYEPVLEADTTCHGSYQTPIWAKPDDMLRANLKDFSPDLAGKTIVGKVQGTAFVPYDDRAVIVKEGLATRAQMLACAKNAVDVFFLEVQGSGRLLYPSGQEKRLGYAAQNGHAYVPIGRLLADQGVIDRPVSMQKIRAYLAAHPDHRQDWMNENPSFVFFQFRSEKEPVGALGLPLASGRSLAIDKNYIPLGAPLWLDVDAPASSRLVFTMDTGGAIKGPVRGDLFWGHGAEAEEAAGHMQSDGLYYLLLPKGVTPE